MSSNESSGESDGSLDGPHDSDNGSDDEPRRRSKRTRRLIKQRPKLSSMKKDEIEFNDEDSLKDAQTLSELLADLTATVLTVEGLVFAGMTSLMDFNEDVPRERWWKFTWTILIIIQLVLLIGTVLWSAIYHFNPTTVARWRWWNPIKKLLEFATEKSADIAVEYIEDELGPALEEEIKEYRKKTGKKNVKDIVSPLLAVGRESWGNQKEKMIDNHLNEWILIGLSFLMYPLQVCCEIDPFRRYKDRKLLEFENDCIDSACCLCCPNPFACCGLLQCFCCCCHIFGLRSPYVTHRNLGLFIISIQLLLLVAVVILLIFDSVRVLK